MISTKVKHKLKAQPTSDGAGVKIKRASPAGDFSLMDPFLMLDEIRSDQSSDYLAGFPAHPHRGFETITYMRQGTLEHEDHMGNKGVISNGGAQWMTAGRGVIHSEMPRQHNGTFHGFQLWLNLPASEKMRAAEYHNLEPEDIPSVKQGAHSVRVLAGEFSSGDESQTGPIGNRCTEPLLWDIELNDQHPLPLTIPAHMKVMLYVYEGELIIGDDKLQENTMGIVEHNTLFSIKTNSQAKALLLGGKPLNEPVVQYGPFVMNSREQIEQAIQDYQLGTLAQ